MTEIQGTDNMRSSLRDSGPTRGDHGQADVSTEQRSAKEDAWFPGPDEDRQGAPGAEAPARERAEEIDRLRFSREDRLHHRRQFEAIYSRGTRIPGRLFVLFILPNDTGRSRLGVTLSRKVGIAVVRNRARRLVREIFRAQVAVRAAGLDIVVHARPEISGASLETLRREFERGMNRYGQPDGGARR